MVACAIFLSLSVLFQSDALAWSPPFASSTTQRASSTCLAMVASSLTASEWGGTDWGHDGKSRVRKKYKRKREKPLTEKEVDRQRRIREARYEEIKNKASGSYPSIFSFESLFPEPVIDEATVHRDLYEITERDEKLARQQPTSRKAGTKPDVIREMKKIKSSTIGSNSMMRAWREPKLSYHVLSFDPPSSQSSNVKQQSTAIAQPLAESGVASVESDASAQMNNVQRMDQLADNVAKQIGAVVNATTSSPPAVDRFLTRMVEDRVYGYRRSTGGAFEYDTSLMGDGAVKFRDGVRLGNPSHVP